MLFKCKVRGITPYMQHRMDDTKLEKWEKSRGQIIERADIPHEDVVRAEFHCYRDSSGFCYVPAEHLRAALINGSKMFKSKMGTRTVSMKGTVAAMVRVLPEEIRIAEYDMIDKRSVNNQKTKSRVIAIRPKWSEGWEIEFMMEIGEDTLTDKQIFDLLEATGKYIAIGSYRPACNGYFGRFEIASFERVDKKKYKIGDAVDHLVQ